MGALNECKLVSGCEGRGGTEEEAGDNCWPPGPCEGHMEALEKARLEDTVVGGAELNGVTLPRLILLTLLLYKNTLGY